MNKIIWKFPLDVQPYNKIEMPSGAKILSLQVQNNKPTLWILVEPERATREIRTFAMIPTGGPFPDVPVDDEFCLRTHRDPRVHVASGRHSLHRLGKIFVLGVDETPHLVALDELAFEVPDVGVMEF